MHVGKSASLREVSPLKLMLERASTVYPLCTFIVYCSKTAFSTIKPQASMQRGLHSKEGFFLGIYADDIDGMYSYEHVHTGAEPCTSAIYMLESDKILGQEQQIWRYERVYF
jgi:hypothetical protein